MSEYRPPHREKQGTARKADGGIAKLTWSDTKVRITFENENTYKLLIDDLPEYAQGWNWMEDAYVKMDNMSDDDKIFSIRPVNGTLKAKCTAFATQDEDSPPVPQTRIGEYGPYQVFFALLTVTTKKVKGVIYPTMVLYNWADFDGIAGTEGKGRFAEKADDFYRVTGVYKSGELPFKDNLLPSILKRILSADKEFQIVVENGQVTSFADLPTFETDDDEDDKPKKKHVDEEEDEEETKPKKVLKKKTDDDDM